MNLLSVCALGTLLLMHPAMAMTAVELAGHSTAVTTGLSVVPQGMTLRILPGVIQTDGIPIPVAKETSISLSPVASELVSGEELVLGDKLPQQWGPGTHLKACTTYTPLPGCLDPESLKLELAGTLLQKDKDFRLDPVWAGLARVEGGAVPSSPTKVLASYAARKMRMDTLCVDTSGIVQLLEGVADKAIPAPPDAAPGAVKIAHIFLPYGCTKIEPWQVLPVGRPLEEPSIDEMEMRGTLVKNTLSKLRSGKAVTIVTWGDSVTAGGDASRPELAYANLFISRLKERFPSASIKHVNAGIGGTNTDGRLPKLDEEVLSHKPDLVTIEFVNDMGYDKEHLSRNWNKAIDQITSAGAEVIIITPHFTMPEMMGKQQPFGPETRPAVGWLKEIAAQRRVALADTSRRWERLEILGIPYTTLLTNGINHPDDRGHEMFVKDLLTFLPSLI